jgi:hypothetical protein
LIGRDIINQVLLRENAVIIYFIFHPQQYEAGTCNTNSEAQDINGGKDLSFQQVPPGDFKKSLEHKSECINLAYYSVRKLLTGFKIAALME